LAFHHVSFAFDEHVVLRDISFDIPRGTLAPVGLIPAGRFADRFMN